MVPYHLINQNAPMPDAFKYVQLPWARYIVATGALISLATCLLSAMFALSRILYAIADDGLVFRVLARIHQKFKTPLVATWCCGLLSASLAAIFELEELVNMTSIGTLLAYTLVSISVLILRYETPDFPSNLSTNSDLSSSYLITDNIVYTRNESKDTFFRYLFRPTPSIPNVYVTKLVHICTCISGKLNKHSFLLNINNRRKLVISLV
jgi:solute carrier family 7 (cationic amino acid transporter), member 3